MNCDEITRTAPADNELLSTALFTADILPKQCRITKKLNKQAGIRRIATALFTTQTH
jgi:hypothetical protein